MSTTAEKTVRELALENPAATRVFEKLGIDYCCGGDRSLEEACRIANLNLDPRRCRIRWRWRSSWHTLTTKDRNWEKPAARGADYPYQEHPPQVHS